LCSGLSAGQLAWRPQPTKWSIEENLLHLITTTETFLPVVVNVIAESRRRKLSDTGPFHLGWYGRLLVWYVEPPPRMRLRAPKKLRPQLSVAPQTVLEQFLDLQAAMSRQMEEASDLNLTGLRFPSPLAWYVRMNLLEFFSVFNGHSRRHLWQATNVRREISR
jgi:DinB superfamily